jgi:hypothetical protein
MINLDPRQEQQLADELDALLTAHLQQRPLPPINPAVAREAKLAQALLSLAALIEPDPIFLSTLERRLNAAAQPAKRAAPRPSFWQQLTDTIKEGFAMKRIGYALATLLVLFGLGYAVWTFWGGMPTIGPDQVAEVDPDTLPRLPGLGSAQQGLGGGGDGTMTGAEMAVEDMPVPHEGDMVIMPWNPLADASFDLTVDLPTDSGTSTVYDLILGGAYTEAEAAELARRFGFTGPLYREIYPVFEKATRCGPGHRPFLTMLLTASATCGLAKATSTTATPAPNRSPARCRWPTSRPGPLPKPSCASAACWTLSMMWNRRVV